MKEIVRTLESPCGISELAARHGITVEALRYYEREGLIETSRNTAGQRVYDVAAQDALAVILALRGAGFGIREIARFMALKSPATSAEQRLTAAEAELARLRGELTRRREAIDHAETLLADWQQEIDEYRAHH